MYEEFYNYKCPRGEHLPYEFLYHEYIELNLAMKAIAKKYNIAKSRINQDIHYYNIQKSKEMITKQTKNTCMERFGAPNPFACRKIQNKVNQTLISKYGNNPHKQLAKLAKLAMKQKYGVDNPMYLDQCKEKSKQTCLKKYGVTHVSKCEEIKQKIKNTNQRKFGGNAPMCSEEIKEKTKQTNLERYGETNYNKSESAKQKLLQDRLNKYGTVSTWDIPGAKEKYEQTNLERYGHKNAMQNEEIKEKVKQSNLKHFGVEYSFQAEEVKQKSRETCLQKYGVDIPSKSPAIQRKIFESMKANGSLGKSNPEIEIENLLIQKFNIIEKQYNKDPRYPFLCDFYIPELDLFIEYQGYEGHGKHPYNPNSKEDIELVNFWKQKANEINYKGELKSKYNDYITVWTIKDPLKRKTAKDNNLNWIEFFSMDEFMKWFHNL